MTSKERVKKVLNFKKVDRIPVVEWSPYWDETVERWKKEGMPTNFKQDYSIAENDRIIEYFGLDPLTIIWIRCFKQHFSWTDRPDISSIEDYYKIKDTLYPEDFYYAPDLKGLVEKGEKTGKSFAVYLDGFFWSPRFMMGIEKHFYAFYDIPEVMKRINEDITQHLFDTMNKIFRYVVPELAVFAEDLAYKSGSMISKQIFDEFIAPYYKQLIPFIKSKGIKVFVDSDGQMDELIDWFYEIGVDGFAPMERQAGCDIVKYRKKHPKINMIGGFDKMTMFHGEENMREENMRKEFERIFPVMQQGGYIPSVDHQTPPQVSLKNYMLYLKLLRYYCEEAMKIKIRN